MPEIFMQPSPSNYNQVTIFVRRVSTLESTWRQRVLSWTCIMVSLERTYIVSILIWFRYYSARSVQTIGRCKKIWLLFPSTSENLELYITSTRFSNRLAHTGSKLQEGVIVETYSTYELEFPAGTLHAVFTTIDGFLTSINYSRAECLSTMSRVRKASLPMLRISPDQISGDFQAYSETLSSNL
jgi:hypothetical protein